MHLDAALEARIAEELDALGYELVKIESFFTGRRSVLRIFIDRPDGAVTVDDCVRVTKALSLMLDGVETMSGPYNLEVSSPGWARPLTKLAHFERFRGERARVEYLDEGGAKVTGVGNIVGVSESSVTLVVDGVERAIPFGRILKANLSPEERGVPRTGCRGERGGPGTRERL